LLLAAAEALSRRQRRRTLAEATVRDGWLIGLAQALALVPGASRSGSTLTAAFLLGFEREAGARFSFLLSVPAIVLAGLYKTKDFFAPIPHSPGPRRPWPGPCPTWRSQHWWRAWSATYPSPFCSVICASTRHLPCIYRVALGALILYLAGAGFLDS
jgi:hypothetical protein